MIVIELVSPDVTILHTKLTILLEYADGFGVKVTFATTDLIVTRERRHPLRPWKSNRHPSPFPQRVT